MLNKRGLTLLIFLFFFLTQYTHGQAFDESEFNSGLLFEQVFGKKQVTYDRVLSVFVSLDKYALEHILVTYEGQTKTLLFPADILIPKFQEVLTPKGVHQIRLLVVNNQIKQQDLEGLGFEFYFDLAALKLRLISPVEFRQSVSLLGSQFLVLDAEPVSKVSGYLNTRFSRDFFHDPDEEKPRNDDYDFKLNLNVDGVVFQTFSDYSYEKDRWRFRRPQVILNNPEKATRYVFGSFQSASIRGLQVDHVFGTGVKRVWDLNPQYDPYITHDISFLLKENALVYMEVNKDLFYSQYLQSGSYDFSDLPLSSGNNDIHIFRKEDDKRITLARKNILYDPELLLPTELEGGVGLGYEFDGSDTLNSLNWSEIGLIMNMRRGIDIHSNISGYTRYKPHNTLLGAVYTRTLPLCLLNYDHSFSQKNDGQLGFRSRLDVEGYPMDSFWGKRTATLGLSYVYFSSEFNAFSSASSSATKQSIIPYLQLRVGRQWSFIVNGTLNQFRTDEPDALALNSTLFYFMDRASAALTVQTRSNEDYFIRFRMTVHDLYFRGQNVTYEVNSKDEGGLLNWSYYNLRARKNNVKISTQYASEDEYNVKLRANLDRKRFLLSRSYQTNSGQNRVGYSQIGHRGRVSLEHDFTDKASLETNVSLAASLAYADGHFGIGAPIQDSFVLLYPSKSLKGSRIEFSRDGVIDWMGPAVISRVSSYRGSKISIKNAQIPLGVNLGKQSYSIFPSFQSGTGIKIGEGGQVMLRGRLVNEKGLPYSLLEAQIVLRNNPQVRQPLYTSRSGKFVVVGLEEGIYDLVFFSDDVKPISIEVKESETHIMNIGDIELKF